MKRPNKTGLSTMHINPLEFKPKFFSPEFNYYDGASLMGVRLNCKITKPGSLRRKSIPKRGIIKSFSKSSRRRLLRRLAIIRRDKLPMFATLTYPDLYPEDQGKWYKHLFNFSKRLNRQFPLCSIIWKLEIEKRKSGENKGKHAPHFHLLIWGITPSKQIKIDSKTFDLKEWISLAWYEVVGLNDERHFKAGTRIENIRSLNGVMHYASKYLAKSKTEGSGHLRYWGKIFSNKLPIGLLKKVEIDVKKGVDLIRLGRRFMKLRGRSYLTLSWQGNASVWAEKLDCIQPPESH
jgi:hypothetical protein